MNKFRGRNVIITGASRGIGAAVAERLAAEGAQLVLVSRTVTAHDHLAGSLQETVSRCQKYGASVHAIAADLSDVGDRMAIIPAALEHLDGRIDVLINRSFRVFRGSIMPADSHGGVRVRDVVDPGRGRRQEASGSSYSAFPPTPQCATPHPTSRVAASLR